MLLSFSCVCGNNSKDKAKLYEGSLGYEAVICLSCGRYSDAAGEHEADEWSRSFLPSNAIPVEDGTPPNDVPDQVLVMDRDFAKRHPGKGFYLRIKEAEGVNTVRIEDESTLPGAKQKARALGYHPTHLIELPSGHRTALD